MQGAPLTSDASLFVLQMYSTRMEPGTITFGTFAQCSWLPIPTVDCKLQYVGHKATQLDFPYSARGSLLLVMPRSLMFERLLAAPKWCCCKAA